MEEIKNLIRQKNLDRLKLFLFNKQMSLKAEMSKETGMSVVTINSLVKELVEAGIFIEGESVQKQFRPPSREVRI